jgi:membrane-associated protein
MQWITDVLEALKDLSGSPWFYLIILAGCTFDSLVPVVPSETLVIAGGVAAGLGDLNVGIVIAMAWIGAVTGDHLSYLIGRRASPWVLRRAERREKTANRLRWASDQIRTRGGLLLLTARFIPAGRVLLTLSAGITRQRPLWFTTWVVIAVTIWSSYSALLGFVGGQALEDNPNAAYLAAFGFAFAVTGVVEIWRAVRNRRLQRRLSAKAAERA